MKFAPWAFSLATPCGVLRVEGNCYFILSATLTPLTDEQQHDSLPAGPCELYNETRKQLDAYFNDGRNRIDLPVMTSGSDFQQRVWTALEKILPGQTMTYGQLAREINSSAQAVGNALRENPVALIIPCHRVVAANGLGGYAGETEGALPKIKQCLLAHESRQH